MIEINKIEKNRHYKLKLMPNFHKPEKSAEEINYTFKNDREINPRMCKSILMYALENGEIKIYNFGNINKFARLFCYPRGRAHEVLPQNIICTGADERSLFRSHQIANKPYA